MDGGAWWATVHGVTKSWTRLSDFTFTLGEESVGMSPGALPSSSLVFQLVCCFHRYWAYNSKSTAQPKMESCFQDRACSVSLLQILWCSAFFIVQLSHPYMTTRKTLAMTVVMYGCESWTVKKAEH